MNTHVVDISNATPIYRYDTGDGFRLGDKYLKYVKTTKSHLVLRRADTGIEESFPHELVHALFGDEVRPLEHLPKFYADGAIDEELGNLFLGDLPLEKQKATDFKIIVCERFLDAERETAHLKRHERVARSDDKMRPFLEALVKEMSLEANAGKRWSTYSTKHKRGDFAVPNPRTVRKWLKAYEEDNDPLNLVSARGGRSSDYFTVEESVILDTFVSKYASEDRPTMVKLHGKMKDYIVGLNESRRSQGDESVPLRVPSLRTFQNKVNSLNDAFVQLGRAGKDKTSAQHRPTGDGRSITRAFQLLEIDEWKVDWRTLLTIMGVWQKLTKEEKKKVPRERLYITAVIDYASKSLVSFRVHRESPSIMTVLAALEMACMDKSGIAKQYGCIDDWSQCASPEAVAADSASWYTRLAFRVTVNDLKAKLYLPPAGAASARGTCERFFRTCSTKALESFSGRTFGSVFERGDYDSDALACLPYDKVAAGLTRFFVDVYQNTPHQGLHGETPKEAYGRLLRTHRLRPPPSGRRRRHIFGINVYRVLGRHGIRFLGIPYQSPALQSLFRRKKQKILFRVDRFDLGQISVWNGEGWTSVDAPNKAFKGMSIWTWRAICISLRDLHLSKAKLSIDILRKARADLEAEGEILRLEAGLDSPILTQEKFDAWEKEMDRAIEIVDDHGNVPGNFVEKLVFAPEFYRALGIEFVPPKNTDEEKQDPLKGWIDPLEQDDTTVEDHQGAVKKAARFDR